MAHNRIQAARLMSMQDSAIDAVYEVADGTLVVTTEGAQTLIDAGGRCSAVFPRRDLPGADDDQDDQDADAGDEDDQDADPAAGQPAAPAKAAKKTTAKAKA